MKMQTRQFGRHSGSALILVVVVTVLLAVVGVMFLMVSRAGEMETAAVIQGKDLDAAVDTVVSRIDEVLVADLFGTNPARPGIVDANSANPDADEPWDFSMRYRLHPGTDGIWNTADDQHWKFGPDGQYGTADDVYTTRPAPDDNWLASLEPVMGLDGTGTAVYFWRHITDLYDNNFGVLPSYYDPQNELTDTTEWDGTKPELAVDAEDVLVKIIGPKDRTYVILQGASVPPGWSREIAGARADADGDGVADSRWVQVPELTTSRGEPVFAAVRIIDNGAMLNLNTAHCFYQGVYADNISFFKKSWFENSFSAAPYHNNQSGSGRWLTEINYLPFLRGRDLTGASWGVGSGDGWYNLMQAKGLWDSVSVLPLSPKISQNIVMNIENPGMAYRLFDIGDELELRNRYLVTSKTEARFESAAVANFTLDAGGGTYGSLETPVDDTTASDAWKIKADPSNFDLWSGFLTVTGGAAPYRYDRRHVCTFYSFDRTLPTGAYPVLAAVVSALKVNNLPTPASSAQVEKVFMPVGPVTTDIETPLPLYHYTDAGFVFPYAGSYNNVETRRKILHLLYGFREYFLPANYAILSAADKAVEKRNAALKAAQVVANLIDYSDSTGNTGPFAQAPGGGIDYGTQLNEDCTFLTKSIIDDMIFEVSRAVLGTGMDITMGAYTVIPDLDFGLNATDIVFGYERQPFISEVYAKRNSSTGVLEEFAIELLNPYPDDLKLVRIDAAFNVNEDAWRIKVGDGAVINTPISDLFKFVPKYDQSNESPGRYVIRNSNTVALAGGPLTTLTYEIAGFSQMNSFANKEIQLLRPAPQWVKTNRGINFIVVDSVSSDEVTSILLFQNQNAIKRQDTSWKFIYPRYQTQNQDPPLSNYTHTLGQANRVTVAGATGFQLAVADDGNPLSRWHELETLSLYGPQNDPNTALTSILADPNTAPLHFDLAGGTEDLLDYVCTINRPDIGSLPGRININTAPVHVIAAAIPPALADPNAADPTKAVTFSALQLADAIVKNRPYEKLSDLLNKTALIPIFKQYDDSGTTSVWKDENVGMQSIEDDIEEEHWILSNLANKFTVRSDVFTAYILVRLGQEGPQRRMIAIFDRSQVWTKADRPKRVALHPVPDPR
jgi:hypothetical protein